jgi:hypothetical protein
VGSRPGQATLFQQLPQQLGVGLVGRGPPLGATQGRGLGRLGQVRLAPGGLQLLDHEPPARAPLHRERPVMVWQLGQPSAQPSRVAGVIWPRWAWPVARPTQAKVICRRCTSNPPTMLTGTSLELRPCGSSTIIRA